MNDSKLCNCESFARVPNHYLQVVILNSTFCFSLPLIDTNAVIVIITVNICMEKKKNS